jgi:serine/threonine protein kinase
MSDDPSKGNAPAPKPRTPEPLPTAKASSGSKTGAVKDPLLGQKLQDYILEARIGVGGMGVVYAARHALIDKRVAIKVLRHDIVKDARDIDRLLEEARTVSSIRHRGIINIFAAGTLEDGRRYLIMELLEGQSLEQKMQADGLIAPAEAVDILEQVLSALAAAHSAGVVHRDLKPANVYLVAEDGKRYVKLLDFGLARRSLADVTRIAGTPDYISPEHARGRPAGPPADLYSFGVLCFHMLTGELPFTGKSPMEVMEQHVHKAPPIPHELNADIPKALSELILKLMQKEPGQRPEAPQVKADLRAATRQIRSASTQSTLDVVTDEEIETNSVKLHAEAGDTAPKINRETDRGQMLEREAKLADVKRTVARKWPILVGAGAALWLLGVAIYVLWPSEPEIPVKPQRKPTSAEKSDVTPPTASTVANGTGPKVAPVIADDSPPDVPAEKDPAPAVETAPVAEDLTQPLDDFRLGEMKRQKRIDEYLDDVQLAMRRDEEKKDTFERRYLKVKALCDAVKTRKDFFNCDDALTKLRSDLYKLD